ncbi:MAG: adenylate/guanylate cyclase domain-containing protein [Spirochaetales bacterium]|nr:adenylate/guanylate cyclase domain-containing protein [Spirochaetales bacterium]
MDEKEIAEVDLQDFFGDSPDMFSESGIDERVMSESSAGTQEDSGTGRDVSTEQLKTDVARYYLNKQLEEAIVKHGKIPEEPVEAPIGVGFVDIVNYSYISSWLSARENQAFLNGLYTAFHSVLKRHGGYLNKISGDSMMFHFGGNIDPLLDGLDDKTAQVTIARKLLYTCIEVQKTCRQFNDADADFLKNYDSSQARRSIRRAFSIIKNLRENLSMVSSINAMFQVKIRIGACMGDVCIGNFGPEDARQWDIIGEPVIEARRMESTAPVDGLRISQSLYKLIEKSGIAQEYFTEFVEAARVNGGLYQHIRRDELFLGKTVILQDKNNVTFDSYAVQTNPLLPEIIREQVALLLEHPDDDGDEIVSLLTYHRGNRHVVNAIEDLFTEIGVHIRKLDLLIKIYPKAYRKLLERFDGEVDHIRRYIQKKVPLFTLFRLIDRMSDLSRQIARNEDSGAPAYTNFASYIKEREMQLTMQFQQGQKERERYMYIQGFLLPFLVSHIKASIIEFKEHQKAQTAELLDE